MKKNKHHMTEKDIEKAKKMLSEGYNIGQICETIKISRYKFDQTMKAHQIKEQMEQKDVNYAAEIRDNLTKNETFGKVCDETDEYILELLREGIPEVLIAQLLGLSYDSAMDIFVEYQEPEQNKVRKQAKAEHFITELLKYSNAADSKEKINYLKILKESKDDFNTTKDDSSNQIKVIFTNFDRDILAKEVAAAKSNSLN